MGHVDLIGPELGKIALARAEDRYDDVVKLVAATSARLSAWLESGQIGMEWFSGGMRAIIEAAGW